MVALENVVHFHKPLMRIELHAVEEEMRLIDKLSQVCDTKKHKKPQRAKLESFDAILILKFLLKVVAVQYMPGYWHA